MEPGGRRPAPPPVRIVQEFLNSSDALTVQETLNTPADLERWMRRHALDPGPTPLQRRDLTRALRVREAIRTVAASHNGRRASPADIEALNGEAAAARWRVAFHADGRPVARPQGSGVTGLVAELISAVVRSEEAGIWDRLKACPACGWAFFDHSRNRRGQWCTMAICGSRAKMRAFRIRARSVSPRARPADPGR